nr:helix-turn-helix transcriptional regulator [Salinigranum rubrum]
MTAFQRDTLYVLARDGAQYGLAIKRALEDLYGLDGTANDEVHHGRLYPNLRELEDRGLLEVGTLDKRTNEYDLSEAGQQFVRELAQTWVGATDRIDRTDQDVIDQAVRHAGGDR